MLSYKSEYRQPKFDSFTYKLSIDYPIYAIIGGMLFFIIFCIFFAQYMPNFMTGFLLLLFVEVLIAVAYPIIKHNVKYYKHIVEYTFDEEEIKIVSDNGKNVSNIKYSDINDVILDYMENRRIGVGYYLTLTLSKRLHSEPIDLILSDNKSEVIKLLEDKIGFRVESKIS